MAVGAGQAGRVTQGDTGPVATDVTPRRGLPPLLPTCPAVQSSTQSLPEAFVHSPGVQENTFLAAIISLSGSKPSGYLKGK